MKRLTVLCVILFVVVPAAVQAQPTLQEKSIAVLVRWFECDECEEGQLKEVVALGEFVVPSLRAALHHGASPATRELVRRGLDRRYDELLQFINPKIGAPFPSREEFISTNLEVLDAQYRVRAAKALAEIGGKNSKKALEEATRQSLREDERAAVTAALAKLNGA